MTAAFDEAASAAHRTRAIEDRATRPAVADAREYRRLRPLAEPVEVDFADYLDELCRDVALASGTAGRVRLGCAVTDDLLPIATAVRPPVASAAPTGYLPLRAPLPPRAPRPCASCC